MNKQYFLKLKNGEKFYCTEAEFNTWLHNLSGDYVVIKTPNGNLCFIKKVEILLGGYFLKETYDVEKGKR